jgi:glycosyltransferase involved in cell wall biosynthesis
MSAGCEVVCSNYGALPETCANFATMYGLNENNNKHANLFANVLVGVIHNYWNESNQNKRNYQKSFFDNFYSWDLRAQQWTLLLEELAK